MLNIKEDFGFVGESMETAEWIREHLDFYDKPVYEVIRLIDKAPLFFNEHIQRLHRSCRLMGWEFNPDAATIKKRIQILAETCRQPNGNLQLVYGKLKSTQTDTLLITFIPHVYPTNEIIQSGVAVTLLAAERSNPQVKLAKQRPQTVNDLINSETGFYEVLMVNSKGFITEGSRSNVFFIKGNSVYTSPENEVLQGITREKVLQILKQQGFDHHFQLTSEQEISAFDAVFLSGTSPGIIPVRSIDKIPFRVDHPLIKTIRQQYQSLVEEDVADRQVVS